MNLNEQCDIARDLMPLSIDGVSSPGSQRFLDDHVAQCLPCQRLYTRMKAGMPPLQPEPAQEAEALRKGLRWVGRRYRGLWIALLALLCAFVLLLIAAGVNQLLWNRTAAAPLEMYDVSVSRQDALFSIGISAIFPKQTFNGFTCEEQIVTAQGNHTGADEAVILTYTVSWLPNQAREYMKSSGSVPVQGFAAPGGTSPAAQDPFNSFTDTLHAYSLCVDNGLLYQIDHKEALTTTYGRQMILHIPSLPVSEIRLTDGKSTETVYTWGDDIHNVAAGRVDEYGLPLSGALCPGDLGKYSDYFE